MIALVIGYRFRAPRRLPRPEAMDVEASQVSGIGR
jgi:hypothetical protein